MENLLTIPEELFLITVNEKTGRKPFLKSRKFDILLAASILMELALQNRIDTDIDFVIPDKPDPTGHPLLDPALEMIRQSPKQQKIAWWLLKLAEKAGRFREILVAELVHKGLLKKGKEHVFLGFASAKYPILIRDNEVKEVKTRIREVIFGKDLPDFRDMVIISVAWYGGLLNFILTEEEIREHSSRIDQLAKMDLIGQAVTKSLQSLTLSILVSMRAKEILGIKAPEEKLEDLVEEMKALTQISNDSDLPEWLRKGAPQYQKTLDYIRETGTNEIVFNKTSGTYGLKAGADQRKSF
jgi:hypothetical protein